MDKVNIKDKFALINTYWDPKIVGELNGQHVKLVTFQGEFDWHRHDDADEMFYVIQGEFDMQFRDQVVTIGENEFIIVPQAVEHCPKAANEVQVMLFEPAGTLNTGDVTTNKTVAKPEVW